MDYFNYVNNELFAEQVPISDIAKTVKTPCYIYSQKTIERHWHAFNDALGQHDHLICYAVKANSNLAILNILNQMGSGFDVVSGGELFRALKVGADPKKIIFSGVGKTHDEIRMALDANILCINVESESELHQIEKISSEKNISAPVSLRINPDVDAKTHPYISTGLKENKFGIEYQKAKSLYLSHSHFPHINFIGIDCHIGSQLTSLAPFIAALDKLIILADELTSSGLAISHLDLGGGLGVTYHDEDPPAPFDLAKAIAKKVQNRPFKIILEPGRAIMANAGILVTNILHLKPHHEKNFAIVDAAMNDLLRPALYQAYQQIIPVIKSNDEPIPFDIVGPVCESGDFLGHDRRLALREGDLLAIRGAGAYGFSMSSNYNSRPRVAEILVNEEHFRIIRHRESYEFLCQNEVL